ncbi:phosphatase PAP2 family protein [Polaromonas sp.]|jgi:membrane-associated phospholipid phosphatase|uniref:phosphatase PAP2 family protein n=1 Tax=Polaromonas sp. TaxID=1869339 RepID=UPI002C3F81A9|nr:phosphatase PAP2 family protein [Polaromonas sp.]HQS32795.1 phosphatase PAP2 family protein [Polaromonas sp.]HQS92078.1 phosphatase PAP2 family protein [Polaromonas sp.]
MSIKRWDSWVRVTTCQAELFSPLQFSSSGQTFSLGHVDIPAGAGAIQVKHVASLKRPSKTLFESQLPLVHNYADLREDRGTEIISQSIDSSPFWAAVSGLQARHRYTLELLSLAQSLALYVEMRFKHAFACPRPIEYSPQIQPMLATPGHGSWPSGHATEAFLAARVLQELAKAAPGTEMRIQLQRLAARIAINRTVAGVHFPVDSAAGRLLGHTLGSYFLTRCNPAKPAFNGRTFDGTQYHNGTAALDFDQNQALNNGTYNQLTNPGSTLTGTPSDILQELWQLAAAEWQ